MLLHGFAMDVLVIGLARLPARLDDRAKVAVNNDSPNRAFAP